MITSFENRQNITWLFPLLLLCVLLLSSCSAPQLTSSSKTDIHQGSKMNDVLVLSMVRHPERCKMMDNALVNALTKEKVEALQSYKVSEKMVEETKDAILQFVQKVNEKSIMIITIGNVEEKSFVQDSVNTPDRAYGTGLGNYFGTNRSTTVVTNLLGNLDVNVYDIKTKNLLWTAHIKVNNPKITPKYFKKIADSIVRGMKKDGVI